MKFASFSKKKLNRNQLPSGDYVDLWRWEFVGVFICLSLIMINQLLLIIPVYIIIRYLGPLYEYHIAWFIEDPENMDAMIDAVKDKVFLKVIGLFVWKN